MIIAGILLVKKMVKYVKSDKYDEYDDAPWLIVPIGFIYVIEFLSDILQIAYIKTHKGKKLFRMAPIHHHYEMGGWSEKKICKVFVLVSAIGSAAAIALSWFGRLQ